MCTLGVEFDIIARTTRGIVGLQHPSEMTVAPVDVLTELFFKAPPYPTGEALDQVGCFTLTAGIDAYGMVVEDKDVPQHLADFAAFWTNNGHTTKQRLDQSQEGAFIGNTGRICVLW